MKKSNSENGGFFASLGRYSARHAKLMIGIWMVILAIAGVLYLTMFSKNMTTVIKFTTNNDSQTAENLFAERFPFAARSLENVVISSNKYTTDDPEFWAYVDGIWTKKFANLREQGVVLDAQYPDPVMRDWMPLVPEALEDMLAAAEAVIAGAPSEQLLALSEGLRAKSDTLRTAAASFPAEDIAYAGREALVQGGQAVDGSAEIAGMLVLVDSLNKVYDALYPMTQGGYLTKEVRNAQVIEMKAMVDRLADMKDYLEATGPGTPDRPQILDGIAQLVEQGPLLAAMYEAKWMAQLGVTMVDELTGTELPSVAAVEGLIAEMAETGGRLTTIIAYVEQNVPQSELRDSTLVQLKDGASQFQTYGTTLMPILSRALSLVEGGGFWGNAAERVLKLGLDLAGSYIGSMKVTAQDGLDMIVEQTNAQIGQVIEGREMVPAMLSQNLPSLEAGPQQLKDGMVMITSMVGPNKDATLFIVHLDPNKDEAAKHVFDMRKACLTGTGKGVGDDSFDSDGFRVRIIGMANSNQDMQDVALSDLKKSMIVAVPIALIVLFIIFGSLGAAMLPIILALVVIVISLGISAILGTWVQIAFAIQNIVALLGLALGIDHALFLAYRYREERRKGRDKIQAIARANATAGHAIFWAGVVVIISFIGIMFIPCSMHRSLGLGAFVVLFVIMPASLTLVPAMLSVLGNGFDFGRLPWQKRLTDPLPQETEGQKDIWHWVLSPSIRAPIISFIIATALLLLVIMPYTQMKLSYTSVESLPPDSVAKSGLMAMEQAGIPAAAMAPVNIAIDGYDKPAVRQATIDMVAELEASGDFFTTIPVFVNGDGTVAWKMLSFMGDPFRPEAADLIRDIRSDYIGNRFKAAGGTAHVAGQTAMTVDFLKINSDYMDPMLSMILVLRFFLLMLAFRAILISVFLTILSVLSLYAGYGMVVWVFQQGHGFGLYQKISGIDPYVPFFLMCGLLGISMDFLVFMASRVRERFDQNGGVVTEAMMHSFRRTGFVIMGVAAVMVVVFFSFSVSKILTVSELGFGMAIAMVVDGTLVNFLLSPACMKLLGRWLWWWPSWLNWLPDWRAHPGPDEVPPEENVFSPYYQPAGVLGFASADSDDGSPQRHWRS